MKIEIQLGSSAVGTTATVTRGWGLWKKVDQYTCYKEDKIRGARWANSKTNEPVDIFLELQISKHAQIAVAMKHLKESK